MKRSHWIAIGTALALAGGAQAAPRSVDGPRPFSYDIVAQNSIPANETCGHYGTNGGYPVSGVDWAVNGVVVAYAADGINYANDGSPYVVAFGQESGGVFTEWYSEWFYPQPHTGGGPPPACLQI